MRRALLLAGFVAYGLLVACGSDDPAPAAQPPQDDQTKSGGSDDDDSDDDDTPEPTKDAGAKDASQDALPPRPTTFELHFAFINGFQDPADYVEADRDLVDLEAALTKVVTEKKAAIEAEHKLPLVFSSVRINPYTSVLNHPLIPALDDGAGVEVARKWREQTVAKLKAAFPNGERNIVLIGHSTGARVAYEITANVDGNDNVGGRDWGLRDRIAGVVSVNGMLDALAKYKTLVGVVDFENGCKNIKKAGWCAYAANFSALAAAEWVAANKRTLAITSSAMPECGLAAFSEPSDQALPLRAQGTVGAPGLLTITDPTGKVQPAHVISYGSYCHWDLVKTSSPRHAAAVAAAAAPVVDWLFESAPRVVNADPAKQVYETSTVSATRTSSTKTFASPCPSGLADTGKVEAVGACLHPDGGVEHAMAPEQLVVNSDNACGAKVAWKNTHTDSANPGVVWFKTYGGTQPGGFLSTLP